VRKFVILFLILLLPSIAYLVLSTGKHNIKPLGYFGPKELNAQTETLFTTVFQLSTFTDQDDKAFWRQRP
jgi:hypothetical protein